MSTARLGGISGAVPVRLLEMGDAALLVETGDIDDVLVLAPALDDLLRSGDEALAQVTDIVPAARTAIPATLAASRVTAVAASSSGTTRIPPSAASSTVAPVRARSTRSRTALTSCARSRL